MERQKPPERPSSSAPDASTTDPASASQPAAGIPASMFDQVTPFPMKSKAEGSQTTTTQNAPSKPPAMENTHQYTADEIYKMLNRTPLFMTELDETDGEGGENIELEALKALAYEGTRAEVAENFRQQGNEAARERQWLDAREYYTKALDYLHGKVKKEENADEPREVDWLDNDQQVVDLEEEAAKEKTIEEACFTNRALCNLELQNYGSTNRDCAAALKLNPRNVKAYYRSAQACFALDKLEQAADSCDFCIKLDPANGPAKALQQKIAARLQVLEKQSAARAAREDRERKETAALQTALKARKYQVRWTKSRPTDVDDAKLALETPTDAASVMNIPVLFLYPTAGQSDFIKAVRETDTLTEHLEYILPCPWDESGEFGGSDAKGVDCFADTVEGGMIKIGKGLLIGEVLAGGKAVIEDGMWRVYVVPRDKVPAWVEEIKKRKSK